MNCEELRDGFELYSLGLLEDGEEKSEIEAHLARHCDVCSARMTDALAVHALFLSQTPEVVPPARLKRRVLGAVGVQPMGFIWLAAAAAAAMLILALWFSVVASGAERELAAARATLRQNAADRDRLQAAFQFLQDPETRQVTFGTPQSLPPRGNVYVHPRLGVLLVAGNLPALNPTQAYEMWVVPKTGAPRPAGLFQSSPAGVAMNVLPPGVDMTDAAVIAVTVEPAAGSPAPTSALVLTANLG